MAVSLCARRLFLSRGSLFKTPKRNGYIILLPEIGEDLPQKNPLLNDDKLPEFSNVTIEKCISPIARQTVEFEELIQNLGKKIDESEDIDLFKDVLNVIEEAYVPLETIVGIAKTLYYGNQSLIPSKSFRRIHDRAAQATAARFANGSLYRACVKAVNSEDLKLTHEQRRILLKYILNGKLNGLDLTGRKQGLFTTCGVTLVQKYIEFSEKLETSRRIMTYTIKNPEAVNDFPDDLLKLTATDPTQPHVGPWVISLIPTVYIPFMEYCSDRTLRKEVWEGSVKICSIYEERMLQTSSALEEIRGRRIEQAKHLNYQSYAHLSMETKMAGSLENVYNVLDILLHSAFPAQKREIAELNKYAKERRFDDSIQLWDIAYWRRKQFSSLYKYTADDIKKYFPFSKVLSGLFELTETLFNVRVVENKKADVWHQDVRFFDVFDLSDSGDHPIASFYLDPYARDSDKHLLQNDNGLHVTIRHRSAFANTNPLCSLIFSFQPPAFGKPSMLTFAEVKVLFQRFGHALHQMLTPVGYSELSGLSFTEWDVAYISDYFMNNWLYEPSALRLISGHYETGETLPDDIIHQLQSTRTYLAGYDLCRELYLSRLDLELHNTETFWPLIVKKLWKQHFVFPLFNLNSEVCSFETIFPGRYGAAYYSFLWAQMLAADAFSAFHETAKDDMSKQKEIANRYRHTFFALSSIYPACEIFRRFRGRDPSPAALLKNLGLENVENE